MVTVCMYATAYAGMGTLLGSQPNCRLLHATMLISCTFVDYVQVSRLHRRASSSAPLMGLVSLSLIADARCRATQPRPGTRRCVADPGLSCRGVGSLPQDPRRSRSRRRARRSTPRGSFSCRVSCAWCYRAYDGLTSYCDRLVSGAEPTFWRKKSRPFDSPPLIRIHLAKDFLELSWIVLELFEFFDVERLAARIASGAKLSIE